ncbi:serine/threonine protein kinase [Segetibacter koreensis]|uniref:serine/threonine protein kinase n=1 Tax=Segetibacter koreensis TaxID=398037 RepID=UPI0003668DD5|nr:serine/threonine-protein kinase [Segetibacter koreensis]
MEKFRLSKNISISDIGNYTDTGEKDTEESDEAEQQEEEEYSANDDEEEIPNKYLQGHYILYDEMRDREYLINDTIKYFIDKFSFPKTKAEVLQEIQADIKNDSAEVEQACSPFFDFLCKRKVLVPEDYEEAILVDTSLYNEGESVGNFTILKVISNRRFIEIYLARDRGTNNEFVIKLLNRNKTFDQTIFKDELGMLEREFKFLENVKHIPAMCRAYFFNKMQGENPYIILEYIKGKSLHRFLTETPSLNKTICFRIIEDILRAFSMVHKSNLVHGDIHSSNILITDDNSVKIIDMGLTLNVEEIEKNELIKFGGVIFYMPPERINITTINKYTKKPDLYSDVYQIGLLMYLILYGKTPFKGFIWEELATNIKISDASFPRYTFLNYPVPHWIINIVKRCLAKNPVERFKNATEILVSFERGAYKEKSTLVNRMNA